MARTAKALREENSRQAKLAAIQAEAKRRRSRINVTIGAVVGVFVVVIAMIVVKVATDKPKGADVSTAASSAVIKDVTSVPAAVFDKVGLGSAGNAPVAVPGGTQVPAGGLPKLLYVGAEYCPYCAAERWGVVAGMARFGTFTGLGQTSSSSTDTDPNTPTLSFHGAKYTSKYFTFAGYEQTDRNQQPLDTVPAADQKLLAKYDATPYLPSSSAGSIPFIFFGGKYIISGASYDPGTLAGMTHAQVAKAMSDPTSKVAQGIDGTANVVSALICTMTNQQPANVCSSSGVQAAAKLFNSAG